MTSSIRIVPGCADISSTRSVQVHADICSTHVVEATLQDTQSLRRSVLREKRGSRDSESMRVAHQHGDDDEDAASDYGRCMLEYQTRGASIDERKDSYYGVLILPHIAIRSTPTLRLRVCISEYDASVPRTPHRSSLGKCIVLNIRGSLLFSTEPVAEPFRVLFYPRVLYPTRIDPEISLHLKISKYDHVALWGLRECLPLESSHNGLLSEGAPSYVIDLWEELKESLNAGVRPYRLVEMGKRPARLLTFHESPEERGNLPPSKQCIDELADDLGSGEIHELMERARKREETR